MAQRRNDEADEEQDLIEQQEYIDFDPPQMQEIRDEVEDQNRRKKQV